LFDPAWRLSLCTVAQYLQGYFDHGELKSSGDAGELQRKTIISLDKHFIGKETTPLDDDSELIDDGEEPVLDLNEFVLRGNDWNLRPLIEAQIEFRRGKRPTYAELAAIKSSVEIRDDGTLSKRDGSDDKLDADALAWRERIKTWRMLCSFGRFQEISELTGQSIEALNKAARFGDNDGPSDYLKSVPPKDFDWPRVRDAIDMLSGRKATRAEARKKKTADAGRAVRRRTTGKTRAAVEAIMQFGYEAVETMAECKAPVSGAARKATSRRKAGIGARYTPEMQLTKFIKEARRAPYSTEFRAKRNKEFGRGARGAAFTIFEPDDDDLEAGL
jgi:hypothetical protein